MRISTFLLLLVFLLLSVMSNVQAKTNISDSRQWRLSETINHAWRDYPAANSWTRTVYCYNQANSTQVDSIMIYVAGADSVWSYNGRKIYGFEQLSDGYIVSVYSGSTDITFPNYIQQRTRYKSDGNILYDYKYSIVISDSARCAITYSLRNIYDNNGRLNECFVYDWDYFPSYNKVELSYDDYGRKITQTTYTSYDTLNYTRYLKTESEYMTTGNPYRICLDKRYIWSTGAWTFNSQYAYEYFNNDLYIRKTLWMYSWEVLTPMGSYDYFYDSAGHLIRQYNEPDADFGASYYDNYYIWTNFVPVQDYNITPVAQSDIKTMPNPFNSSVKIIINSDSKAPCNISIYNIKGQMIKRWGNFNGKELIWDGRDSNGAPIAGGLYLLKSNQNGKARTAKLLKYK